MPWWSLPQGAVSQGHQLMVSRPRTWRDTRLFCSWISMVSVFSVCVKYIYRNTCVWMPKKPYTITYQSWDCKIYFFFIYSGYFIYVFDSVCSYVYLCTSNDNPLCIDLPCFLLSCGVNEFLGSDNLACYSPADDMSTSSAREGYLASGVNSILPKEHAGSFVNLPISKAEMDNGSVCSSIIYTVKMFFFII